ncbi:MAG: phosphoglycolate phosphatase-like HAD superfamily hydrolase [Planctomycetota bacterium]|jgi:phosphoglycolate phosphatase-like HAD superfamily hydrolase
MRILTDFDGVWTDQAGEARFIQSWLARVTAPLIGATPEEALRDFDAFFAAALAQPASNGWAPDGRITGFADEDLLMSTGSVFHWLENGGSHPRADLWRSRIRGAGHDSIEAYASDQFQPAMTEYLDAHDHRLVDGAADVVRELLLRGHEIAFVSNSSQNKLATMLGDAGILEGAGVRVIGNARKWWIRDDEPLVSVAGRRVHMDRPHYRAILEDVRPDLVIGDVASFDLALPAYMRSRGELSEGLRLVLRRSANTSAWALAQPGESGPVRLVDEVVDSVRELL